MSVPNDFMTYLLGIIVCNGLLYVGFYGVMKVSTQIKITCSKSGKWCRKVFSSYVKKWKKSVDKEKTFAVLLADLTKPFDCSAQHLVIAKLNAYGFSL